MHSRPLVSIITPTFNHEAFISECIRSVLAQTYSDWEMIIIDDESTDDTFEIANSFARQDNRIKIIQQHHRGIFKLSETYNKALEISSGEYIAILEGDDIWVPEKLDVQVEIGESDKNLVVIWGQAYAKSADLTKTYGVFPINENYDHKQLSNTPRGSFLEVLLLLDPIPAVTILFRKSALLSVGGFKQVSNLPTIDHPVLLELCSIGSFYYKKEILATWRAYAGQTTKTYPVELWNGKWKMALNHFNNLDGNITQNITLTAKKINNYYEKNLLIAYARSGRYKLIRKDFVNARKDYLKAIFYKKFYYPLWRIRAIIGYISSFFNTDIERLSQLLNRVSYKSK
jgi:glycosyltransferase involved in cell wall biosynthesis